MASEFSPFIYGRMHSFFPVVRERYRSDCYQIKTVDKLKVLYKRLMTMRAKRQHLKQKKIITQGSIALNDCPPVTSCRGKLAKFGDKHRQSESVPTCTSRTAMKSFSDWSRGVDAIITSSGCRNQSQRMGKPPPRITWTYFSLTRRATQSQILNFRLSKERSPNGKQSKHWWRNSWKKDSRCYCCWCACWRGEWFAHILHVCCLSEQERIFDGPLNRLKKKKIQLVCYLFVLWFRPVRAVKRSRWW